MSSFGDVQASLAPLRAEGQLGSNIVRRQPDVEVMCMLLNDLPLTVPAFDAMRKSNDWISMAVGVVAAGPPGFSSVPYSSSKKPGEKDVEQSRLYTVSESGKTVFSTFEKMKNNKDRGKRVEVMDVLTGDGEKRAVNATAVLTPGVCLSTYIREDFYTGGSAFYVREEGDEAEMLPAGTLIYMAMGTKNAEQAIKGQLLKFKKIKRCTNPSSAMSLHYNYLPTSLDVVKDICKQSAEEYPSIGKQINQYVKNAAMGGLVNEKAYVSYNDQKNEVILSQLSLGSSKDEMEVVFDAESLMRHHGFSDPCRMVRWINIGIQRGSVGVLILAKCSRGEDGDYTSYIGCGLNIDLSTMMAMQAVFSMNDCNDMHPDLDFAKFVNDNFVWSPKNSFMNTEKTQRIVFVLGMKKALLKNPWNEDEAVLLITDGCKTTFNPLSVYSVEVNNTLLDSPDLDIWKMLAESFTMREYMEVDTSDVFTKRMILSLQFHKDNKMQTANKRKRPENFVDDPRDILDDSMQFV